MPTRTPPQATRTAKPKYVYISPTPPFGTQPWRFEAIPIGDKVGDDQSVGQNWKDFVESQAVNLSVVKPYSWEEIRLPDQTRYAEIREYYVKTAQEHGYTLGRDEQGQTVTGENTYLMTFYKGFALEDPRVVLEFWAKTRDYPAFMLIFYSNPE